MAFPGQGGESFSASGSILADKGGSMTTFSIGFEFPLLNLTVPFGVVSSQENAPRQIQFALFYTF